jgi:hypothetical protein
MLNVQTSQGSAAEPLAPADNSSPKPPTPSNPSADLANEKLRAEIAKTLAEADKLRAEAHNAGEAWNKLWRRPAAWAAILPGIAAIAAALWQLGAGFLEAEKRDIEARVKELTAERTLLKGEVTQLEVRREKLENEQGLKREALTLQNEKLQFEHSNG